MMNILDHDVFAKLVVDKLGFCAEMKNYKCDFCGMERADVLAFNDKDKICGKCEEYLFTMKDQGESGLTIIRRMKLIESLRTMIDSIGLCASPMIVMSCFKVFFEQLRKMPEYETIIQEGIKDGGRNKETD
jgi:hypothetical protein